MTRWASAYDAYSRFFDDVQLSKNIVQRSVGARVDGTIDLDRESKLVAVEIDDVPTDYLLATEL